MQCLISLTVVLNLEPSFSDEITKESCFLKSTNWSDPVELTEKQTKLVSKSMRILRPKLNELGAQVFKTIFTMRPDLKKHFGFEGHVSIKVFFGFHGQVSIIFFKKIKNTLTSMARYV